MQLSESLTISIILTLVFGAVFYYLYSRLGQSEKRVSLLENILLDLKVAMESNLIRREDLDSEEFTRPPPTFFNPVSTLEEVVEETEVAEETQLQQPAQPVQLPQVVPEVSEDSEDQYDKMTNKELKDAAKNLKLKGYSTLSRSELQDMLRNSENVREVSDGVVTLDA